MDGWRSMPSRQDDDGGDAAGRLDEKAGMPEKARKVVRTAPANIACAKCSGVGMFLSCPHDMVFCRFHVVIPV